jgi:hypothetical protein
MTLRVLEPTPPPDGRRAGRLAERVGGLEGKRLAFVDAWARHTGNPDDMYPLLRDLQRRLLAEHGVAEVLWFPKANIATPLEPAALAEFIRRANGAVIGEAI